MVRRLPPRGRAVGRARRRLGPVRRRAAGGGRRADLAHADAQRSLEVDLPNQRVVVEPGVTNVAVSQRGRAHALLPARPVQPDRLHDRRQRRRELRRRPLLQVRLHHQLRDRARARAPRRRARAARAARSSTRPAYDLLGAFVGSEGTLGVATKIWLRVVPVPEAVRTLVAFFGSTTQAGEVVSEIVSGGIVPGRHRDDGQPLDPRRPRATPAPATRRRRRGARGRAGRLGGRVRDALRAGRGDVRGGGRRLDPRGQGRRRAHRDLDARARPPSRRWAASRPTTTCRTA